MRWEVALRLRHGFVSLNQSALAPLRFSEGDGASDGAMRFVASPAQLNAALAGWTHYVKHYVMHYAMHCSLWHSSLCTCPLLHPSLPAVLSRAPGVPGGSTYYHN